METKLKYQRPRVRFGETKRKSMTIPDQSLTIQEIVKRFVKGIPVNVVKRDGTYLNQSEHDFEKITRMDPFEKAALADEFQQQAQEQNDQLAANERAKRERAAKKLSDAQRAAETPRHSNPLDNTMPVDTNQRKGDNYQSKS